MIVITPVSGDILDGLSLCCSCSMETKRLFIGGLSEDVSASDLSKRFSKFGSIQSVDIKVKRDDKGFLKQYLLLYLVTR